MAIRKSRVYSDTTSTRTSYTQSGVYDRASGDLVSGDSASPNVTFTSGNTDRNTQTIGDGSDIDSLLATITANKANYSTLLQLLGGSQDDPLIQLLTQLGVEHGDMNTGQAVDWNKQLLDSIIAQLSEKDARNFNIEQLKDQRLYDSPTNQLARLMAAGVSRDAAIQLLGGSGASAGAGVSGSAAAVSQGIPASQSALNETQNKLMPINTVFGAISAISSSIGALGSFGISAASLSTSLAATRAMTAGQNLSNTQLAATLKGIESASTVISAISSAVDAGVIDKNHNFDSAQDMLATIRKNAGTYQPFNSLVQSGALDSVAKDIYSLQALNAGYKSWRESRDMNLDRKHITRMYALDELFKGIDIGRVNSEILLNQQHISESIANVLNSTKIADSTVALNESMRLKNFAETSNIDAQTDLLHQQYELQQMDLDWLTASIDDINSVRTTQLMLDVAEWNKMTPAELEQEAISWLKNKQNQRTLIALESYYYGGKLQAANDRINGSALTDQSFANTVVYMHNLFSNALPDTPRTQHSDNVLGDLAGSAAARYLLKFATKVP